MLFHDKDNKMLDDKLKTRLNFCTTLPSLPAVAIKIIELANDPDAEVDVGMLKEAMLAAQRLESTAMQSHKREKEIRQAFAEEVAAKTEQIVTQAGLTKDTAAQIRREILGIA